MKAFLSDWCKEIQVNNRMGKTRDLFKKIRDTKPMATHSSTLAWTISETEEPSGLPSMGSHRVGHNWSDLAAAAYLPFVAKLLYNLAPTLASSKQFSQANLRCCLPGLKSQELPPNKT